MDVDAEIARVQLQIEKVENDILKVEKDIQQADNALQSGGLTPEEKNYGWEQKQTLQRKEEALRAEEQVLREKENKCLDLKLKNGISFDDINGKPIQLPERVQLSEVAFCWHAVLAIEEAKRRGVLPEGFALDANKANFALIDLYFASQQDVSMSDDLFVDSDSSFEEDVYARFDDSSITRCWTGKPSVDGQSSR